MPDGSFNIFEIAKIRSTAGAIAMVDWKIAVSYQTQVLKWSFYSIFGWMLEDSENPLDWAKRELLEESWLVSDTRELLVDMDLWWMTDKTSWIYIAKNCKKMSQPVLDNGEIHMETILLNFEEFIDLVIYEKYNWESIRFKGTHIRYYLMYLKVNDQLDNFKKSLFSS